MLSSSPGEPASFLSYTSHNIKTMRYFLFSITVLLLLSTCGRKEDQLFRQLDALQSGVSFRNDLRSSDTLSAFNFTNFYNGGGVGVADFNQDGIPDICFTANQQAPELYLGKGKLQFEKLTESGLKNPGWVSGISIVDINQDGWPDIYLSMARHTSFASTANQLYINQATPEPSFVEAAADYGLDFPGFTMQTVFFDYDLDGDLDAYLLNTDPDSSNPNHFRQAINDGTHPSADKLFENTGRQADGTYRYVDASTKAGIRYEGLGLGVALTDFNQDGLTDIYCSNDFQSDDALYLNQGDGTFRNVIKQAVKHTSLYGMGIDAADFNNDQHRDIFQLDMLPEGSARQKQMIARGDYEKKRLSVSPQFNYNLQYMRNTLQVNQGVRDTVPLFSEQGFLYNVAATDWSWSVLLADYDLDGWKDVFITNGYRKNVTDLDFISYNKNNNMFGNAQTQEQKREQLLSEIPEIKLRNYAFKNIPNHRFEDVSKQWGLDQASYSNGAAYADLDLDGDLDLIVNNIDEVAFLYENQSSGKHWLQLSFQGTEGNREGIGASVTACTGDTCQSYDYFPARGYLSSMNTPLVIGLGPSDQVDRLEIRWPDGKRQVITQVAAGQQLKLLEADASQANEVPELTATIFTAADRLHYQHRESDFVDFHKTPTLQKMLTRCGPVIERGDFNGDRRMDIVIGGAYGGSPTVVYLQREDGYFIPWDTLPTEAVEVGALAILDANQDGFMDIFVAPGPSERPLSVATAFQPRLFLGTGNGFRLDPAFPTLTICSESVLARDLNGDGQTDLLISGSYVPNAYPGTFEGRLLLGQNGSFEISDTPWLNLEWGVKDMVAVDIDQDEDLDILLTGHWGGVHLLRNKGGHKYAAEDLDLPTGWWNCVKATDLDGDGDIDLVLGNEGLNSIYRASADEPVSLFAKDFNRDGRIDPIWTLFLQGKEAAVHPLGTLTDQVVQYKKRFTRFSEYADAELDDLFTSGDLSGAMQFQATELRSGIAVNDGNGHFAFQALPLAAQRSPVSDLLVKDFNDDGETDLLLIGNFYANEPIFGQNDASFGTVLLGQGNKGFEEFPMTQSGLKLDGDTRKLLYLEDEQLILVTQNQGKVQSFHLN